MYHWGMPVPQWHRELFQRDLDDPRHGSVNGYINYRCRCEKCLATGREYHNKVKAERKAQPIPEDVHGTYNGYTNYGCRCDACIHARAERTAVHNQTRRQKVATGRIATARERLMEKTTDRDDAGYAQTAKSEQEARIKAAAARQRHTEQIVEGAKMAIGMNEELPGVIVYIQADRGGVRLDLRRDPDVSLLTRRELAHAAVDILLAQKIIEQELSRRGMYVGINWGKEET